MMTATALQQKRVEDLKQKRHKVDVHKEAVRLYTHEMEKPEGAWMSSRQVQDHIQKSIVVLGPPPTRWPPPHATTTGQNLAAAAVDAFADDNGETVVATHECQQAIFNLILYMRRVH
jgi:hypothetical protein